MADGGASSKASRIMKALVPHVNGLENKMTAHGLHVGASDDMAFNVYCHIVDMIYRGNWDLKGDCQIFNYLTNKLHVSRAGKALAGWPDCCMAVASPSLFGCMASESCLSIETYASDLFSKAPPQLQTQGDLVAFRDVMLMSLFRYGEAVWTCQYCCEHNGWNSTPPGYPNFKTEGVGPTYKG